MLDTGTCIALIKGRSDRVLKKLRGKTVGQVGVSSITLAELQFGVARSSRPADSAEALFEFLLPLEIAPFDAQAAEDYGVVRAALASKGAPIGPLDTLIAAHTRSMDVVLVTHNRREFDRVPGLRVEDWLAARR